MYAAYRQVYNAGDPTVCTFAILLGHPFWGSVFGPVSLFVNEGDTEYSQMVFYSGEGSVNIMAIQTLLSKDSEYDSEPIPNSELETIVFNFTKRIKEACGL